MPKDGGQPRWPVLIVGAGPVGMLLALLLGRHKICSLLVEKHTGALEWSKAIGITPPSLAIFAKAGVEEAFTANGVRVTEAMVHDDGGIAGAVRFDQLHSEHKFILTLPQARNLEILADALESSPYVEYRRGLELVQIAQRSDGVEAGLQEAEGGKMTTVHADWLVGCDGSKSTVRRLLNLDYRAKKYPQRFVMADFEENTGWGRQAHLFFTRHGSLESFPLPAGKRRWVAMITKSVADQSLEQFLAKQTERIAKVPLHGGRISPLFEFQPERLDMSRLHRGRAILAGDAAHLMSPIGGQGMNTGLADADLLAEILSRLLSDDSASGWLGRYENHRRRAARAAARRAALGMWLGTRTGARASTIRSGILRHLLLRSPLRQRLPPHFAMLTIPDNSKSVK